MRPDETAHDFCPAGFPAEFRENYRFLSVLIECKGKNDLAMKDLEVLVRKRPVQMGRKLNQRQMKIIKDFIKGARLEPQDRPGPPVPPELEASLRVRQRSTWLPWEAEAIRKIERWRKDISFISSCLRSRLNSSVDWGTSRSTAKSRARLPHGKALAHDRGC
jgi:hypothetical protein